MGERYWVTGVQLGMLKISPNRNKIIDKIIENQFIDNFPTDKDKKFFNKQIKLMRKE